MSVSFWQRILPKLLQPKVALPLGLLLIIVMGPFVYRGYRLAGVPDIDEPFDIEAFDTVDITNEENAFVEYKAATKALVPWSTSGKDDRDAITKQDWSAASESVRKWLEDNTHALELWRKGTEKPNALYYQPKGMTLSTLLNVIQELRELTRLAQWQALELENEGNVPDAWKWCRAIFRCSRHAGLHGCLVERLVGIALHSRAADSINAWARHADVDASLIQKALAEVVSDYKMTAPTSYALKVEHLSHRHLALDGQSYAVIVQQVGVPKQVAGLVMFVLGEPKLSTRVFRLVLRNQLSQIDVPRQERLPQKTGLGLFELPKGSQPKNTDLTPSEIKACFDRSLLAKLLLPAYSSYDYAVGKEQARQAALVTALAVQLFYRRHNRLPDTLTLLVGDCLDAIPLDPFGKPGDRILYRRDGDAAIVWSVGKNGVDDGGNIENTDDATSDIGYKITVPVGRNR